MRIAYVITRSDTIGGAHVHLRDLAKVVQDMGHEVKVYVGGKGPFTEALIDSGIPYHSLAYLKRPIAPYHDIRAVWELRRELMLFNPDLVACHSSKAGWIGRIAARTLRIPAVFTAHGWAYTEGVPPVNRVVYRVAESLASPLARRIITVSESDRQLAIRSRVAPQEKLVTIRNGIPRVDVYRSQAQAPRSVKLIMVARLDAQKNHGELFAALEGLKQLEWSLDLIGDGPLELALREMSGVLGIKDRVNFLGLRDDVPELLADAQIFLLISNWEGFPLSILEAMQAGLPVVASDVGGVSEALIDQETGFLVQAGDVAGLKACIENLVRNASLRESMGRSGKRRYQKEFTIDHMVKATLAVYEDVLREKA